ncbi:MAG TPA: hypothetical protein VNO51_02300 [Ilumatobacteraceae bacterium]|nr:hypothetical protein [Ilumatobacteraceae bacterium]
MWIVAGAIVVVVVAIAVAVIIRKRRATRADRSPAPSRTAEALPPVHALDDALRTVESLTDATGSSLLDQVDRDGRTIRDRLASGEAHLDSLRQPDDTGPLLRRVLDEVAGTSPADGILPPPPPAPDK